MREAMRSLLLFLRSPAGLVSGAVVTFVGLFFLTRRETGEPSLGPGPGPSGPIPGPSPMVGPGDRVLLAGDSLAFGLTKPMKALADAGGFPFKGHGVVGSRIDEWDSKYISDDLAFGPTVVVLSLGTNDMKMFDPKTQQAGHARSLLDKIRGAGARVVWVLPPTMPFSDKGVRQMIADAGPDAVIHAEQLDLPRAEDKIHMTPSGYKAFAEAAWNCLTLSQCP